MASVSVQADKLYYGRLAAAALVDLSPRTLDRAIRAGALSAVKNGRRVLIPRDALLRFISRGQPRIAEGE